MYDFIYEFLYDYFNNIEKCIENIHELKKIIHKHILKLVCSKNSIVVFILIAIEVLLLISIMYLIYVFIVFEKLQVLDF